MANTTTMFDFLTNIESGLETQLTTDGLTDVSVYTMPMGSLGNDNIQFIEIDTDRDWLAMGAPKQEQYSASAVIYHQEPNSSEASAKTTRTRVQTIFGSVVTYLRSDAGRAVAGTGSAALVKAANLKQGTAEGQRWCALEFSIQVLAPLS